MATESLQVQEIEVEGLFGLYHHRIPLHPSQVTIVHGPNGIGKTRILRLLQSLYQGELESFFVVPFTRFKVTFEGLVSLEIHKQERTLEIQLTGMGQEVKKETVKAPPDFRSPLAEKAPWLRQISGFHWVDQRDGEILSHEQVAGEFGFVESISSLVEQLKERWAVHLIEAQRLTRDIPRTPLVSTPTVSCFADDLQQAIRRDLAKFARRSQQLDQSFPQRLLQLRLFSLEKDVLKERMTKLEEQRNRLLKLGLLEDSAAGKAAFDVAQLDNIDDTQLRVMELYTEDTEQKLATLDPLGNKIQLLLDHINQRFLNKTLQVNAEKGLLLTQSGQELSLEELSSGEQHQLVLLYELLFKVRPNTLVLIDEPELSLHIGWQESFLQDLLEMTRGSGFQALVATHSPYIVDHHRDLMIGLKASST